MKTYSETDLENFKDFEENISFVEALTQKAASDNDENPSKQNYAAAFKTALENNDTVNLNKEFQDYKTTLRYPSNNAEDIELIKLAINDKRITSFGNMFIEVQNLGAAATELAKPLIDRILSVNPHEQPEIIKDLDMGIRGLPPGAISTITDQIKKLAQTPDTRGLAWITISRLGEAGETAIPTYIELIQAPASQYARPHLNDQQALKGALLGLCQMEHLAVKAKPALIEYVQTPHQQNKSPLINETTGLLAYETIAMTTLVNTMPEEEYKQLFRRTLSESRLQHYISRARDKRCFY